MLNALLPLLISLSLSGSVLVLVLFLCKPLYQKRLSRRWQYYIWLVVIARLLLPFAPKANLTDHIIRKMEATVSTTESGSQAQPGSSHGEASAPETTSSPSLQAVEETPPSSKPSASFFSWLCQQSGTIWLIVAVGLLIRKITIYQSFVKYMTAGRAEVANIELWEQLGILAKEAGIQRPVALYTNSLISSPLLIGFFRPCIVLPSADLPEPEFRCTILHELAHYKRRDMFYKWLVQITLCIHWFNPFVYLMKREIDKSCELACDEAVIRRLDAKGRQLYGGTLLHAAQNGGYVKNSVASVTLNEGTKQLKERLDSIMTYQKISKPMRVFTCLLTCLLLCTALFTGAYAAAPAPLSKPGRAGLPASHASDTDSGYAKWGISEKNDRFYYQEELTRIFMDMKPDRSFQNFSFNRYGTVDICLERDTNGVIQSIRPLSQSEADGIMADLPEDSLSPRQASLIESAALYEEFGLTYSPSSDELYYNGQIVKAFADIKEKFASGGYSFRLGYRSESASDLYLMAVRDAKGTLTGIETMPPELVAELYGSIADSDKNEDEDGYRQTHDIDMIVFNATTHLVNNTITATDKLSQEDIPEDVLDWIDSCQKAAPKSGSKPGTVYTRRSEANAVLDTWVYYGSENKLAWFMEADGSILNIFMKAAPETIEGATLIHYEAPLAYSQLHVYYDNRELSIETLQ